jgi:hypothetical protein
MRLSHAYDSSHKFDGLIWLTRFFFIFLIDFFSQFYSLILDWLGIRFHDLFWFAFYEVIHVSWLGSQVWWGNPSWLELFFVLFFIHFFFNFIFHHWFDWELNFIICFNLLSIDLSQFHDPSRDSSHFFRSFFNWFFFSISFLNIRFIGNWTLQFAFYRVIIISWLGIWTNRLTRVDPNFIQYVVVLMFIKKNLILSIYFKSNYVFVGYPDYMWTCQKNRVTSNKSTYYFFFFLLEKTLAAPRYFFTLEKLI